MPFVVRDRAAFVVGLNTAGALSISSATATFSPGDTVTINGSNLDTVTGVTLGGEAQTIDTQSASQITFTAARGGLKYGTRTLEVVDGGTSDSVSVSLQPQTNWAFTDVAGLPWPVGQLSVYQDASPPVANGDQCAYQAVTDEGANVSMFPNGTFTIDAEGTHHFDIELWDATDATWSAATATVSVNAGVAVASVTRKIFTTVNKASERAISAVAGVESRDTARAIRAGLLQDVEMARRIGSQWYGITY